MYVVQCHSWMMTVDTWLTSVCFLQIRKENMIRIILFAFFICRCSAQCSGLLCASCLAMSPCVFCGCSCRDSPDDCISTTTLAEMPVATCPVSCNDASFNCTRCLLNVDCNFCDSTSGVHSCQEANKIVCHAMKPFIAAVIAKTYDCPSAPLANMCLISLKVITWSRKAQCVVANKITGFFGFGVLVVCLNVLVVVPVFALPVAFDASLLLSRRAAAAR